MKFRPLLRLVIFLALIFMANVFADTIDEESNESDVATTSTNSPLTKDAISDMLLQSVSLMGIPYHWGGNTPETGMDCSGFIRYVFKKSLGITLPRTANEMARIGKRVSIDELQPGDLLFFNIHHLNSHMGMYIGDNKFIQSPHTGDRIKISELDDYWKSRLNGAKRIVAEDQDNNGNTTIEEYQNIDTEALPLAGKASRHKHKKHGHNIHKQSQVVTPSAHSTIKSGKAPRQVHKHKHKRNTVHVDD